MNNSEFWQFHNAQDYCATKDYTETALISENEAIATSNNYPLKRGNKLYQLANHLGNVLATISDRKLGIDDVSIGTASGSPYFVYSDYYIADVANAQDYYPFGMHMPGRTYVNGAFVDGGYVYGFNGMEADDEFNGDGNSYTAEFWQYDPRIGRRANSDPLTSEEPGWSPYRAFYDNPISFVDPSGLLEDTWKLNTETGELTWLNDMGGEDIQTILLNPEQAENGGTTYSLIGNSSDLYVGPIAKDYNENWDFQVSNVDLWEDVPTDYWGHYTAADLLQRYRIMNKGNAHQVRASFGFSQVYVGAPDVSFVVHDWVYDIQDIRRQESLLLPRTVQVWNISDYNRFILENYGTNSSYKMAAIEDMVPAPGGSIGDILSALQGMKFPSGRIPVTGPKVRISVKTSANTRLQSSTKTTVKSPARSRKETLLLVSNAGARSHSNPWIQHMALNASRYAGKGYTRAQFMNKMKIHYNAQKGNPAFK